MEIKVGKKVISEGGMPLVVAEAGVNYYEIAKKLNIDLIEAAKLMVKYAAESGADAIKFQTYKAEKLASRYSPAYWNLQKEKTNSQYKLFAKYDKFGEEEYKELAKYARSKGIIFLSTPFYEEAVDFLNEIVPAFKISSSDITNIPFLRYIAEKGKPIFLSTGASTIEEIEEAKRTIEEKGNKQIVIMHCVLSYPTDYEDANLRRISHLKKAFPENIIGYSDHTKPDKKMLVLTTAFLLGARVIEKHFTLDKNIPGNDHYHSMDPQDLMNLRESLRFLEKILGKQGRRLSESEMLARKYARRSVVAKINIKKGTKITLRMLALKRPGTGISPKYLKSLVGMTAKKTIKKDAPLMWGDLENKGVKTGRKNEGQ